MQPAERKRLNHKIRAMAAGRLGFDEETYRDVVESIAGKRHITECDDEEASLVMLALRKMIDHQGSSARPIKNGPQHRFIARLMDYLRWDWKSTASFIERIVGRKNTRHCTAAELSKVISGMIAICDQDIAKGKIVLTALEREEYERHVRPHRERVQPPAREGQRL